MPVKINKNVNFPKSLQHDLGSKDCGCISGSGGDTRRTNAHDNVKGQNFKEHKALVILILLFLPSSCYEIKT